MAMEILFERPVGGNPLESMVGKRSILVIQPGPVLEILGELEGEDWEDYSTAYSYLASLGVGAKLLDISFDNYNEFVDAFNGFHAAGQQGSDEVVRAEFADMINRRLANYLSSMRMFLDYSEYRFKRYHKQHPDRLEAFQCSRSRLFDTSFAYRFAYKLRNYAQHFGLPVGDISIRERLLDGSTEATESKMTVAFNTVDLLAVGGDCWGPVRRDLRELAGQLDVVEVMREVPAAVNRLWTENLGLEAAYLDAMLEVVERTLRCPDGVQGSVVVGEWLNVDGQLGLSYGEPPNLLLQRLRADCRRSSNSAQQALPADGGKLAQRGNGAIHR
jgi:hypothetical protein